MTQAYLISSIIEESIPPIKYSTACKIKKVVSKDGTKSRYYEGKLHSINDKPAVVRPDGYKAWYDMGVLHRIGKPAIIHSSGTEEYYKHGLRHNDYGPAVVSKAPYKNSFYYLNGDHLSGRIHQALTLEVLEYRSGVVTLGRVHN